MPGLGEPLRIKQFSCTVIGILAAKFQGGEFGSSAIIGQPF